MKKSIPQSTLIYNFLKMSGLTEKCPRIVNRIVAILTAMALKGFTAKMTDIADVTNWHRTSVSYFLSASPWDDEPIKALIKSESFRYTKRWSAETGSPIFVSHDDTVNPKRKPSSQASRPMEGAAFHHSHLLGKTVWGHQVQATMVSVGGRVAFNYDLHWYDNSGKVKKTEGKEEAGAPEKEREGKEEKKIQTKIDYVIELVSDLPILETTAYFMADCWFSCPKIIDACAARGYHYIGALKTNRIIYPKGIHISIADFAAKYISKKDVNLVTVNGHKYYVCRYEGKLNKIDNAVVLMSCPEEAFKKPKALRAFICTDVSLSTEQILDYYTNRWCIETFFSQVKDSLGFGKYQIRSITGIERLWTLMSLFHLLCTIGLGKAMPFGEGLRLLRKSINEEKINFIYQCAQQGVPLEELHAAYA